MENKLQAIKVYCENYIRSIDFSLKDYHQRDLFVRKILFKVIGN